MYKLERHGTVSSCHGSSLSEQREHVELRMGVREREIAREHSPALSQLAVQKELVRIVDVERTAMQGSSP